MGSSDDSSDPQGRKRGAGTGHMRLAMTGIAGFGVSAGAAFSPDQLGNAAVYVLTICIVAALCVTLALAIPLFLIVRRYFRLQEHLLKRGVSLTKTVEDVLSLSERAQEALSGPLAVARRTETPPPKIEEALPLEHSREEPDGDSFLSRLSEEAHRDLMDRASLQRYLDGDVLCWEGRPADRVFVIVNGTVNVHTVRFGVIAQRGVGELVGERAVLEVDRPRSASMIAQGMVDALVIRTAAFQEIIARHPEVLQLVEWQIYDRLAEQKPPRARTGLIGQSCPIVYVDVVNFSDTRRTDADRRQIKDALYQILERAVESAGTTWEDCHKEDRGDGALLVLPPDLPAVAVVESLLKEMSEELKLHNDSVSGLACFQLRFALTVGPVDEDGRGVNGSAIILAARLLDAPILKERLADSDAVLGFVVSTFVFDLVISQASGSGHHRYERIEFHAKGQRIEGWIRLLG